MAKTKHIQQRMSQRSIRQQWLSLVRVFGVVRGDKVFLNQKGIDLALNEMKKIASDLQKMRTRGGIVLVEEEGAEITTYALENNRKYTVH